MKNFLILLAALAALSPTSFAQKSGDDTLILGKPGSSSNKVLDFGSGNGKVRWNTSLSQLEFTNDATNYSPVKGGVPAVLTKSANYTILTSDFSSGMLNLICNCSSVCAETLPAATNAGYTVTIKSIGTGYCSLNRAGSDTIDGAVAVPIGTQYQSATVTADGTSTWRQSNFYTSNSGFPSASGGTITTAGSFKVATFNSSGNLTVSQGGYFKFLLVGGGGGGANGGGGAGGFLDHTTADVYIPPGVYSVAVGSGGAAGLCGSSSGGQGITGGDTGFDGFTAKGGGGGGTADDGNTLYGGGIQGGSGGGGGELSGTTGAPSGLGYPLQGNPGGFGAWSCGGGSRCGGGGGGAATPGVAPVGSNGGFGGSGLPSYIASGNVQPLTAVYYSGGGGGGAGDVGGSPATGGLGGLGGGGGGQPGGGTAAGTANTGGGGGGCSIVGGSAGAGGSGSAVISWQFQ